MQIYSFPFISNANAKILILGTMPGIQSLLMQQYYGHQRNHFWKLLFTIYDEPLSDDYEDKKKLLLKHHIALWDVLKACERQGSLDSAIMKEIPNDFTTFLKHHPQITHLFFNGQKAAHYFKRYVTLEGNYTVTTLPSTSPANASKSFELKLKEWECIKKSG